MFLIYYHMVSDLSHSTLTDMVNYQNTLMATDEESLPIGIAWERKNLFHFRLWRARNLIILISNSYMMLQIVASGLCGELLLGFFFHTARPYLLHGIETPKNIFSKWWLVFSTEKLCDETVSLSCQIALSIFNKGAMMLKAT